MLGTCRKWRVSIISASIIAYILHYAMAIGVICFRVKRNQSDGHLIAHNCNIYKWIALLIRIVLSYYYYKSYNIELMNLELSHLNILICIRVFSCLIFSVIIVTMQFWYGTQVLSVVNSFLSLFRKVNALPGNRIVGFGGKRELTLLLFKTLSLAYEFYYTTTTFIYDLDFQNSVAVMCEVYISMCTAMIYHIFFMGYLSIGALYDQVNRYVRTELRQQLRALEKPHGERASRRELKAAEKRLDECLGIYDEIQRVASTFQQLIDLKLCLILLFGFLNMALVSFFVLLNTTYIIQFRLLVFKIFLDLLLLTLAIHGARSSSRVIRRISLENYYISEQNSWHMKLEMFLSRLNYYEFRVRPLGLFEVSNELILLFLSGMVTYLTYVLQYSLQWQPQQ